MSQPGDCRYRDKPGPLGVAVIVLVILYVTGNCEGKRPAPETAPATTSGGPR